ncbi:MULTISPECIES: OmpA family protein [Asticcacaulis]|uniref:OmpA family protein n=1 Tax=Asticcacaulis TaxID=76890 RepID=UPI001AEAD711|nr:MULTISPECIES: OmpA family protein [Asticcacaulis]MBP2161036.1 outer membrane protein OmpA-like peptidoglycan-associated protein [Asticcacaulis solisilvae]MDR6802081.1 outer membrane protein OmpA-like peptidoglycan-associated protein [Asticcacaulis sp. BE141]
MRVKNRLTIACGLTAAGLIFAHTSAFAQSATTTDDIICKMSDTCDAAPAPEGEQKTIGDEKMFSLQKKQQDTGPEKMFSLQKRPETPAAAKPAAGKAQVAKASRKAAQPAAASNSQLTMQVNFTVGSADLTDGAKTELSKYVTAMQSPQLSAMTFVIEGHTDASGAYSKNMDLSQRRAQSVVDYLVANGVSSSRLKAEGFGPNRPLSGVSKRSPANRRVELVRAS